MHGVPTQSVGTSNSSRSASGRHGYLALANPAKLAIFASFATAFQPRLRREVAGRGDGVYLRRGVDEEQRLVCSLMDRQNAYPRWPDSALESLNERYG
jgi:hypothetical protein